MRDPASDEYMRAVEDALDIAVQSVEHAIILNIAASLRDVSPDLTPAEIARRASLIASQCAKIAERGERDVAEAVDAVMRDMGEANEEWAVPYYEASGVTMGAAAGEALQKGREEAVRRVSQVMRTSALEIMVRDGKRVKSKPIKEAYRAIVTTAAEEMAAGTATGQKAVSKAVTEALGHMCEGGVRIRYESDTTRELYGAVRMNVMDAYRNTMQEGRRLMGEEFGADGVEVSAHGTCAPDHLPYQGRTFTDREFQKVQDGLERPIAQGYNCRHIVHPVLVGVLKPAHTEAELKRMADFSTEEVTFTGVRGEELTMTRYEATQYKRRLEQAIRRENLEAECKEKANADPAINKARAKELRKVYRNMSDSCGLATDMKRTRVHIPR